MANRKKAIRAKINLKIIMVVIPILILTSAFIGVTAYLSASNGITSIAKEFLGFKLNDIYNFSSRQYAVIVDMKMETDPTILNNIKDSILEYAKKVIGTETGDFLALEMDGSIDFSSLKNITSNETANIISLIDNKNSGWLEFSVNGVPKVGVFIIYNDWEDYFIILDDWEAFYNSVNQIVRYLIIILLASIVISSILLLFFIAKITSPIKEFVKTIQQITQNMDLTKRVKIYYTDEIGYLAYYFNTMIAELESAYNQIKNYAYQTVLAKNKEERIRFIFQKYVPSEVINQILNISADSMLIGNKQTVTVLFSDIRSFTTISESMLPEELVLSLNNYFNHMGAIISKYHGIIDKFIGDAIMAIFGAPVIHPTDAEDSIRAALSMLDALETFNREQVAKGKVQFHIGVGLNTGDAIVGNIGSEQKVDYTVIGDTVNLASRLEGLTKKYHARIIVSEFTKNAIPAGKFYYRELDNVRVKGKHEPVKIFEPFSLEESKPLSGYYSEFNKALYYYYQGRFKDALRLIEELLKQKSDDYLCYLYKERCEYLIHNPPENWDGVETWMEK